MQPISASYPRILRAVAMTPWAIQPEKLAEICELLALRASGMTFTAEEIQARIGSATRPTSARAGSVAVLPLFGTIAHRMNMMTAMSGGTSTEAFASEFRQLVADETVGAILIDVDSPGGAVNGVPELFEEIYRARGRKPIVAHANALAASGAYWIASAADEIVVTPSGMVGSIGVITAHEDISAALEQQGRRITLITAGKHKGEGNPYAPLSDEDRAAVQARVDEFYGMFVKAVARGRGRRVEEVRSGFGEGRVVGAREALAMGMVDRVETMTETLARLAGRRAGGRTALAALAPDPGAQLDAGGDPQPTASGDLDRRRRRLRVLEQAV